MSTLVRRAWRVSRRLLRRPRPPAPARSQQFAIGMYAGPSLTALAPWPGATNPVLTSADVDDVPAAFVADPFMIRTGGLWYMFFEVYNRQAAKGEIAFATSSNGRRWQYHRVVLAESFHLSYPYVFSWKGQIYMVPETYQLQAIWLYRAVEFPGRWERLMPLVNGLDCVDPSLVAVDGSWWLYCSDGASPFRAENLRLFQSDHLDGPWREHPQSPVISHNARIGRSAGRVVVSDGSIVRFAQDCTGEYGLNVTAFMVAAMTRDTYREEALSPHPVLQGSGAGWNAVGMHHVDPHQQPDGSWLACVDGWRWGA